MFPVNFYTHYRFQFLLIAFATFLMHAECFSRTDTESQKAKLLTKFPFSLTSRGIIIIKAQFGQFPDTLNFILDTGSGGISLDSSTVQRFNLTPVVTGETLKGIAQKKEVKFLFEQQLRLPNLKVDHLDFHINNYSFLSDANNLKIDGVIGYSFLKLHIVKINYDTRIIEVWRPGSFGYSSNGYIIKTKADNLLPIIASVNDSRRIEHKFYFDTGADMCFLLSEKFIKDSSVLSNKKKIVLSGAEGVGGKKEMMLTTIEEIHIGPYLLKKVPAYIFDDTYNVSNYPKTGGIIGNELMARFNVVLNYPADEIQLTPNAMFNNPFNYSYVGCNILMDNGRVIIKNIVKGSPAELAGLHDDDIIFGINNNFKNDIDEYKTLFSQTGAKLKVFLLRGNLVQSTVVKVNSIL